MRSLQAIRQAGGRVSEIVLSPLAREDVGRLVADSLHGTAEAAAPLADLVYDKTGGNPFFTIQFLTALAEEKLLAFSPGAGRWVWDLKRIRAKGYTDNVVDLMVAKLARLPPEAQEALQWLAALGDTADFAVLALVLERPAEAIHAALWEAVRAGLVLRQDDAYAFLHDRVQEAAYSLIPEASRRRTAPAHRPDPLVRPAAGARSPNGSSMWSPSSTAAPRWSSTPRGARTHRRAQSAGRRTRQGLDRLRRGPDLPRRRGARCWGRTAGRGATISPLRWSSTGRNASS